MAKPKVDKGVPLSKEDCLAIGEEALASFTRDELQDYADQIFAKAASYEDVKGKAAIQRAIEELNNSKVAELFGDCRRIAQNVQKFEFRKNAIESGINLRKILTPRGTNQADNIRTSQNAAKGVISEPFFDGLTKELEHFALDSKNFKDIMNAWDGKQASKMAKEIAKRLDAFTSARDSESIRTGILSVDQASDYKYLDHMHDASAIMNGGKNFLQRAKNFLLRKEKDFDPKAKWVDMVFPKLDPKNPINGAKLIDKNGNLNKARLRKILEKIFDNITGGKNRLKTNSIIANNRETIKNKRIMRLNFKDATSWGEYNEIYGHRNLMSALMADIMGSGNKIGMADMFGTSPVNMYMDLEQVQARVGIPEKISPALWNRHNQYAMKGLLRADQIPLSPDTANFRANLNFLTSTVKLIFLPIRSSNDLATGMAYIGREGHNQFKAFGYMLGNLFNNPVGQAFSPRRRALAAKYKIMADAHLGYVAKAIDGQTFGTWMQRISSRFFNFNFMEYFDKGNKVSVMTMMASDYADAKHVAWDKLPTSMQKHLRNHNFNEDEWNLLRTKTQDGLFTVDNVARVTDEELRNLKSAIPLLDRRFDLYRKVYSLSSVASENTILNADEFQRGLFLRGTESGEPLGEIIRAVMQFKMYPITYFDRVWGQGLAQAEGINPKLMYGIKLLAATMSLSYLGMWMENYSKGKTMPDPSRMTLQEQEKYYLSLALAGSGIFLGLMDPKNQNRNLFVSTLSSPSTNIIADSLSAILAAAGGNGKQAKKELKNVGKDILPVETIPFISPFIRKYLGETPYLQAGQKQIYGA